MLSGLVMSDRLFVIQWTQAPQYIKFPRQEYWSGWPFPPQGDLPNPGTELHFLHWQANSLPPSYMGSPESGALCTFGGLILCWLHFLPFCTLYFCLAYGFLWYAEGFKFNSFPFVYFYPYLLL